MTVEFEKIIGAAESGVSSILTDGSSNQVSVSGAGVASKTDFLTFTSLADDLKVTFDLSALNEIDINTSPDQNLSIRANGLIGGNRTLDLSSAGDLTIDSILGNIILAFDSGKNVLLERDATADLGVSSKQQMEKSPIVNITQNGGSFFLTAGHRGRVLNYTGTGALTIFVQNSFALGTEFNCVITNNAANTITISGSGATIQNKDSAFNIADQYGMATLFAVSGSVYRISGDLS